jgi:hypothetical protein
MERHEGDLGQTFFFLPGEQRSPQTQGSIA